MWPPVCRLICGAGEHSSSMDMRTVYAPATHPLAAVACKLNTAGHSPSLAQRTSLMETGRVQRMAPAAEACTSLWYYSNVSSKLNTGVSSFKRVALLP